jgi:hypothetical protein
MTSSYTPLTLEAAYELANEGQTPNAATFALLTQYALQSQAGVISAAQALNNALHVAPPPDGSVGDNTPESTSDIALATYQFFTGFAPNLGGMAYLVNGGGNPFDLDSAAYAGSQFNVENRYYNFSLNLIMGDPPAAQAFAATYGPMSFNAAVASAYNQIVGTSVVGASFAANGIAYIESKLSYFQQVAARDAPSFNQDLATKAVAMAYILEAGMLGDVGYYASAIDQYNTLIATGGTPNGETFAGINLLAQFPIAGVAPNTPIHTLAQTLSDTGSARFTLEDFSANVMVKLDALEPIAESGRISEVVFLDPSPPALTMVGQQLAAHTVILSDIAGPYTLTLTGDPLPASFAPLILSNGHVVGPVTVSDVMQNIIPNLGSLKTLISSGLVNQVDFNGDATVIAVGQFGFVLVRWNDGGQLFSSPSQLLNNANVFSHMVISDSSATAITGSPPQYYLQVDGTVGDALQFDSAVQAVSSTISGGTTADRLMHWVITDSIADFNANLTPLEGLASAGKIASITFTDSPANGTAEVLRLSTTQVTADAPLLATISQPFTVSVSDSAANVSANLDALQALAAHGHLGPITLTDAATPTLTITQEQQLVDTTALTDIQSVYLLNVLPGPITAAQAIASLGSGPFQISDTSAHIDTNLSGLETLATLGRLTSISVADPATPMPVTSVQLSADANVFSLITSNYELAVSGATVAQAFTLAAAPHVSTISISDASAILFANLDALQGLAASGELNAVSLTDSPGVVSVSLTQLHNDAAVLNEIGAPLEVTGVPISALVSTQETNFVTAMDIADTSAAVAASVSLMGPNASRIHTISLTDGGPIPLSAVDVELDATEGSYFFSLAPKFAQPYPLSVTGTTAQFSDTTVPDFATSGSELDITDMNSAAVSATYSKSALGLGGQLSVTDGVHSVTIGLIGQLAPNGFSGPASAAGFVFASDGAGGTNVTWHG